MTDRASTYGSVGAAVLVFGMALMLGAGSSPLLVTLGALATTAGLAAVGVGVAVHFRATGRTRRI